MGKPWRGYVSSREVGGHTVPQRVQNLVIRNCAEQYGLNYLLSATEYYMDECFMMLESSLEELGEIAGIIFFSTHQLPSSKELRQTIYKKILERESGLRFALEDLALLTQSDIKIIEDLMICQDLSNQVNMTPYKYWLGKTSEED